MLPLFASRPQSQNLTQLSPLVGAEVGLTGILASEVTDSGNFLCMGRALEGGALC